MQAGFYCKMKSQPHIQERAVAKDENATGYAPGSEVLEMGKAKACIMRSS